MVKTHTNMMMGTPIYMSPEQCRGNKTITDRADVYALGVMMFEMMASRPPFWTEAPGEFIAMHMYQAPPPLRSFVPDVDPTLHRLIESMLAKEAQARPSMPEVAKILKDLGNLASDVITVRTSSPEFADDARAPRSAPPPAPFGGSDAGQDATQLGSEALAAVRVNQRAAAQVVAAQGLAPLNGRSAVAMADSTGAKTAAHEDPTEVLSGSSASLGQAVQAGLASQAAQAGPPAAPRWQAVQIVPGSNLPPAREALAKLADGEPAGRSAPPLKLLVRTLRRVRFQLKKRIFGLLKLPLPDKRSTPPSDASDTALVVILLFVLLAILVVTVVLLAWPRGETSLRQPPALRTLCQRAPRAAPASTRALPHLRRPRV